ncbi:hypothetical protein ACNND5_09270, partial [Aerococcus urinaeequi]|uniref:hypothetical protein n=1 Tax=Aerococcus urinaeequi TaxID=51665 RepID=UPI003AAC3E79
FLFFCKKNIEPMTFFEVISPIYCRAPFSSNDLLVVALFLYLKSSDLREIALFARCLNLPDE